MSATKNRIRPLVPSYKKVYATYQFDWEKYAMIYKKLQGLACRFNDKEIYNRVNPYRVLDLCYVLDENGKKQPLGDERHIFRYKTLEKVRKLIANELLERYNISTDVSVLKYLYKRTGIVLEVQRGQEGAEIARLWDKPIRERLSINLKLLRGLRKGLEIEQAVKQAILVKQS